VFEAQQILFLISENKYDKMRYHAKQVEQFSQFG
jgi:hypothetical protein